MKYSDNVEVHEEFYMTYPPIYNGLCIFYKKRFYSSWKIGDEAKCHAEARRMALDEIMNESNKP